MGIADLFRPKYRHSDVRVRTEAIRALGADDAAILKQVARTDRDIGVRRIAIDKIDEPDVLAELAQAETERSLRDHAGERAAQLWTSIASGDDAEAAGAALGGIIRLGDQRALVDVAVRATQASIRKRAFGELRDPKALAELAKREAPQDLRLAAVARIDDGDVLRAIAIDTTTKEIGLAAVEKLDDPDRLDNISQKAKNKAVRQRARKIVQEIEDAEKAKKPGVPDDVKRRRAEKAQLVREVEGVADSFDFDKAAPIVRTAQEQWAKLVAEGEPDDERFTKATERFWRRKELHEQQSRGADELRAIEREAQREKELRAAERAAAAAAEARDAKAPARGDDGDVVAPGADEDEPTRLAREAEAKARREERDKRKAEEDARRAAEQAERDAKKKEAAERAVAIAASLQAVCDDMESMAASDTKDGRAIDRLLQQAAKAFEQLGKVAPPERDALGDRYGIARGKLVVRASELREAEDWERFANVPKAEALIQTAKQMVEAPTTPDLGNRLRALQALWKEVGPMPQRRSKELWEQFKATCDQVYEKVKAVRAVEGEKFAEVAKQKEALIAEAETLADSTDFATTAEKMKALQARWKESGHLPRKQGDELWKRFRAACDRFFERRKPMLDARHAEEADNLANKQALIARAQAVSDAAPDAGGWGKAIAEIKELQRQWKDIGYVPRRDADAVYKAFRAACDSLFAKRDASRDAEANQHRAELDAVKAEIAGVLAGGDDVVARALAVRARVRELDSRELSTACEQMIRQVVTAHADAVKGTELDPAALRARRDKLIAKVAELLPKQPTAVSTEAADLASQLKQAMRSNAFGDLRFSGRDPVEVVDELRLQWLESGPILDEQDRAQDARFEELCGQVLAQARPARRDDDERGERGDRGDRGDRSRRRRERRSADQPVTREEPAVAAAAPAIPQPAHDAITAPAKLPFEPLPPPPAPAPVEAKPEEPARAKTPTAAPPMDELDTGWDLGDSDPTAATESPPSSSEMAGDSATGGDGIDEPGWD